MKLIALAAALMAIAAPASGAATSCPRGARCATISVPLDHSGATPGTLPLAYSLVPATGTRTGTLVLLSGGPGQAAIPFTRDFTELLAPLRAHYDLVFVDQRGTGRSGAVSCGALSGPGAIAGCAAHLGERRAFLNTTETAEDLEDLRAALGADRLTLLGVSYGTKVAGEYARRHPDRTAALVLDSPVPVDGLDSTVRLPELGSPRVLREVCASGLCRRTVGDPAAALAAAAHRLQRGPLHGPVVSPSGRARRQRLTEGDLLELLLVSDLDPVLRAGLPAAVESIAKGDAAPALRLARRAGTAGGQPADGVNVARLLATTCSEGRLPWDPESPVAGRRADLQRFVAQVGPAFFAPFRPATVLDASPAALCAQWPPTPRPQGVPSAGPDVPVLVISGRDDLRTPLEDARRTAAQYPHATVLSVHGVGHSVLSSDLSGCARRRMVAFLAGRAVGRCSGSAFALDASPYIPARIGDLRPTCGLEGRAGRTCSAASVTLVAVLDDALPLLFDAVFGGHSARAGGLRGGWYRVSGSGLRLHRVEWVRGVRLTGSIGPHRVRIVVSGPAAAPGLLEVRGGREIASFGGLRAHGGGNPFPRLPGG